MKKTVGIWRASYFKLAYDLPQWIHLAHTSTIVLRQSRANVYQALQLLGMKQRKFVSGLGTRLSPLFFPPFHDLFTSALFSCPLPPLSVHFFPLPPSPFHLSSLLSLSPSCCLPMMTTLYSLPDKSAFSPLSLSSVVTAIDYCHSTKLEGHCN